MLPRSSSASSIKELQKFLGSIKNFPPRKFLVLSRSWWRLLGSTMVVGSLVLLCFTQTRNFKTFEVPLCKVGWKRWRANLSLAACAVLSMCLHYSRLDCYMLVAALHNSLVRPKSNPGCHYAPLQPRSLVHAGVKSQINLRLLTGLCSTVTPAIRLQRLTNWGTGLACVD